MAKIVRKNQKIFGSAAGALDLGVVGSLAAGSVAYSTDPETIQSLSNYLTGLAGVLIGGNSPAKEDINSLFYLLSYQLAYVMQQGVPEWNSSTTYYIGSLVNSGGVLYVSLTDNNLNNAVTSQANWAAPGSNIQNKTAAYNVLITDDVVRVNNTGGSSIAMTLPQCSATPVGKRIIVKRIPTSSGGVTLAPFAGDTIDGDTVFTLISPGDSVTVFNNGTSWDVIQGG